jgi:hypothetical protein
MRKIILSLAALLIQSAFLLSTNTVNAQVDVGTLSVLEPVSPICAGSQTVRAIIRNYGAVDITSATLGWEVNGSAQASASYSGLIPAGTNDTVTLGTFNFSSSTTYIFKIYTSNPNGGADANNANDTLTSGVFSTSLSGTYTIGGTTPDFAKFTDAVAALASQGVCGPVVFNIRAMVDTMQTIINPVSGASSTNTITFQSENGDSTSVNLLFPSDPAGALPNYLIRLNGADYITFNKLSLIRSGIQPYARVIDFTGTATYNTISNCRIIGAVNNVTNSLSALVYSTTASATNDSMNTFTNNLFENGSLGIYMNGNSNVSLESSTMISSNRFVNQYSKALQISNQANLTVRGNIITSTSTYTGFAAIHLTSSNQSQSIVKNKIFGIVGTGIYLEDCSGFNTIPGIVANNFIQCGDSVGISVNNGFYQDIVFNSVNLTGASATSTAFSIYGTGSGNVIKNNNLVNTGGGYSFVIVAPSDTSIRSADHNNLHFTGTNIGRYLGVNQTSLAAWVTASQNDTNSVNLDPGYISVTDLHATATALDNLGFPRANVTDDIDGTVRSLTTPDIGADEFTGVTRDLSVATILSPTDNSCGSTTSLVRVIISNLGGATETGFNVSCDITGSLTTVLGETYSGSLPGGSTDTLTFSTTINTSAGGTYNMKAYTGLVLDSDHSNDTTTASLTINGIPAAPTATADSSCGQGTVIMTAISSDTIQWFAASVGGTVLDTGSTFTTPVLASTDTFYVASQNLCPSDRVAVIATVLPVPSVNIGNDTTIAPGSPVTLNAGGGFTSYTWIPGGQTSSSIVVTPMVSTCYTVTVSNSFGCENSDTLCVTVIQPTDVGILSILSPSNNDCENATVDINVVVRNFGANDASGVILHVNLTGIVTTSFVDTIHTAIVSGTSVTRTLGPISTLGGGTLNIQAYTEFGPDLDNSNDTIVVSDSIISPPAIPTGLGGSRCGEGSIVISAVASNTVEWYDSASGGTLLFVGNTYSISNLTATTTFYAQNGNFCNSQARTAVTATINPLPIVNLGPDIIASTGQIVTLDAGAGFVTYAWSNAATTQTIDVTVTNDYIVTVSDSNGCSNSDTINVQFSIGINQITDIDFIHVYPNPANDKVTLQFNMNKQSDLEIRIVDLNGRTVFFDQKKDAKGEMLFEYDVNNFNPGMYFIHLNTNEGLSVQRLVVQ